MRGRWLLVVMVASLCLNVAFVGAYLVRRARRERPRRFAVRKLAPEVREKLRQTREAALPGFDALADRAETTDSLLWAEMRSGTPDSVRVDSFCRELGHIHSMMRAMVFRQMHQELLLMPAAARTEYLTRMMGMRSAKPLRGRCGIGWPGRRTGRFQRQHPEGPPPTEGELPPDAEPPELPPGSGD